MPVSETHKDIERLIDDRHLPQELLELKDVLNKYAKKRNITTTVERVNLIIVVGAMLDWKETEFTKVVNRLNRVVLKSTLGIDINQLISEIDLRNKKSGPLN